MSNGKLLLRVNGRPGSDNSYSMYLFGCPKRHAMLKLEISDEEVKYTPSRGYKTKSHTHKFYDPMNLDDEIVGPDTNGHDMIYFDVHKAGSMNHLGIPYLSIGTCYMCYSDVKAAAVKAHSSGRGQSFLIDLVHLIERSALQMGIKT